MVFSLACSTPSAWRNVKNEGVVQKSLRNNLVYKINFFIFAAWFEQQWLSLRFLQEHGRGWRNEKLEKNNPLKKLCYGRKYQHDC